MRFVIKIANTASTSDCVLLVMNVKSGNTASSSDPFAAASNALTADFYSAKESIHKYNSCIYCLSIESGTLTLAVEVAATASAKSV